MVSGDVKDVECECIKKHDATIKPHRVKVLSRPILKFPIVSVTPYAAPSLTYRFIPTL